MRGVVAVVIALVAGITLAAPPEVPFNESPADGAVDTGALPLLCVDVTDPDGDSMDVTFRGRRLTGEPFTIVALPDTQFYSRDFPNVFTAQTQWIVDEHEARNIVFVTHLGDIVQNGNNATQWNNADNSMSLLDDPQATGLVDGIPFGVAPGNHDEAPLGSPRSGGNEGGTTGRYNQHFGVQRFSGREYWGDNYDFGDPGQYANNNDNNYELFTAGGMEFIIVHLEYDLAASAQRTAVLDWLDNVLMAHADRRAIIMTHYMISQFALFSNQGQAIYDRVKDNPNVFLMTGGHISGGARRTDQFMGSAIYSLLSDYQNLAFGGNGYLRVMTFAPQDDEIRVETYSPWLDLYNRAAAHDFTLSYPMVGPVPQEWVGTVQNVPSGGTACVPWSGRRAGVSYEWSVEVSDESASTAGPTWRFTSDGSCAFDNDCADRDACSEDVCDAGTCRGSGPFDGDSDGVCEDVDNCPRRINGLQLDTDGDGRGDVCDACPAVVDPSQFDGDGDGLPDGCDCQLLDGGDREPGEISGLVVDRTTSTAHLAWPPVIGADVYSVTRGELASLAPGSLGDCLTEGLLSAALDDADVPAPGEGYFYLVQGQNFDCGVGHAGYGSDELARDNLDPGACGGASHADERAVSEHTTYGDRTGSLDDTLASDDVHESITEELSGGNPESRHSRLEHRWTVDVSGGRRVELHVEGHRKASTDGDDFVFEYSPDGGGTWLPASFASLPTADNGIDLVAILPDDLSGSVRVRVVDTDRTPGNQFFDWVAVDELFVRSVP